MSRVLRIFAMLILALNFVVGCENEGDPTQTPVINVDRATVDVIGQGGKCIVGYSVENGRRGVLPTYTVDVDWITDVAIESNMISFMVAPSDVLEERMGRITLSYEGAQSTRSIMIVQSKMLLDKFTISIDEVTYHSCVVTYTPKDNEILYIANIIDKEYFNQSGISTEEAFVSTELDYYISVAEGYGRTLEELIPAANLGGKGPITRTFDGMQPGGTYVVYCYGISVTGNSYEITVPVHYELVTLPMPTMYEVDFEAEISFNTSYMATISIDPLDWDGYYYIQIAPDTSIYYVEKGEAPAEHLIRGMGNTFYKQARSFMAQGNTAENYLDRMCYKGLRDINVQLEAGNRYMLILFAVAAEDGSVPVMRSMPEFFYFTTR